jgi:hypothetical protein
MENLEILTAGAANDDDIVLVGDVEHVEPTTGKEVLTDRCLHGVRGGKRSEEVDGCGTDREVLTGFRIEQYVFIDAKLNITVSTKILWVIRISLNPAEVQRVKDHHGLIAPYCRVPQDWRMEGQAQDPGIPRVSSCQHLSRRKPEEVYCFWC